jgi:putative FmdB family regulatory protein
MPFYEYECPHCRYYLEVLQKISDRPLKKCPSCGKSGFKRLMSAPVFRLKGAGWYETDFKSDKEGQRNLAAAEPAEAKPEAKEAKAGAEDKSAAKTDTAAAPADKAKTESPAKAGDARKTAKASRTTRSSSPRRSAKRTVRKATRSRGRR